jgi:uncharacterized protein YprB with RNaseH-like and TPR domain
LNDPVHPERRGAQRPGVEGPVIRSTFQLTAGIGPSRERQLWAAGVRRWEDLGGAARVLGAAAERRLGAAVALAREALAAGDAEGLAAMVPIRERWRLYAAFAEDAAFLDVESDGDGPTVVGVLDRDGPRIFLRGRDLDRFPDAARGWKLLVTFNGISCDVPLLERAFPGWRAPRAHVDVRHLWTRLGHAGGLKLLEHDTGVGRPPHLAALRGADAVRLWREHEEGDRGALRLLAEYNLYDAVNLKALVTLGYNRLVARLDLPAPLVARFERGDVLHDMTKEILRILEE